MFKRSRMAVSALFALGLVGALAGTTAIPASAAPGQVCYFGECRASTGPSTQPAPTTNPSRLIAKRGSWSAHLVGQSAVIVDEFNNGARFAIVAHADGRFGLMLSHPEWRLKQGQRASMKVTIDGETFQGTAVANGHGMLEIPDASKDMLKTLFRGRQGRIEVGDYSFDMTNLADATAVAQAAVKHLETAAR